MLDDGGITPCELLTGLALATPEQSAFVLALQSAASAIGDGRLAATWQVGSQTGGGVCNARGKRRGACRQ